MDNTQQPPINPNYSTPADFGATPHQFAEASHVGAPVPYPTGNIPAAPPSYQDAIKEVQKNPPPPNYNQTPYPNPPPNPYNPPLTQPYPNPPINRTGGATVIINQPVAVNSVRFGQNRVSTICPFCTQQIVTETSYSAGTYAVFVAAILCVCGLGICAFLPFVMSDCQDVSHSCPHCKRHISTFTRM